ncbi:hypothetical protein ZIOFF_054831 [Zingiber officinale]|uniref:Galactose oxidase/kelch repeat superfamily protein n=1 Tax=Zingiber officinale TaxID=94328 RepID=A0A8J5KMV5_ZINOF|nr:hypothetical protein ZIOFF_054831 [Zingiber officinale]
MPSPAFGVSVSDGVKKSLHPLSTSFVKPTAMLVLSLHLSRSWHTCPADKTCTGQMALQSALAYDVEGDAWVQLPGMACSLKQGRGIFVNGEFFVAGGQDMYDWTSEAFDVAWGRCVQLYNKFLLAQDLEPIL